MSERACAACQRALTADEVGLTLKLCGMDSKELFCLDCLSKKLRCSKERLTEMAAYFKKTGCALFC